MKTPPLNILFYLVIFICGCSNPATFEMIEPTQEGLDVDQTTKVRPSCEVSPIDFQIDAQVESFEVTKDDGGTFGFELGKWIKLFSFKFKLKETTLTVKTSMSEFLRPNNPLAPAFGAYKQTEKERGAEVDLGKIAMGQKSFGSTPLPKVMKQALRNAIGKTSKQLAELEPNWFATVLSVRDQHKLIISAGRNAGIKAGDIFSVYNAVHIWGGLPCGSEYIGRYLSEPMGLAKIVHDFDLQGNSAVLTIEDIFLDGEIEKGALVFANKLVDTRDQKTLKRSVQIRNKIPFTLSYKDSLDQIQTIDFTKYLRDSLDVILLEYGFYQVKSTEN